MKKLWMEDRIIRNNIFNSLLSKEIFSDMI